MSYPKRRALKQPTFIVSHVSVGQEFKSDSAALLGSEPHAIAGKCWSGLWSSQVSAGAAGLACKWLIYMARQLVLPAR